MNGQPHVTAALLTYDNPLLLFVRVRPPAWPFAIRKGWDPMGQPLWSGQKSLILAGVLQPVTYELH